MQKIFTTGNRTFLYLLKSKLEDENIHCVIKNENPPLAGEIPAIIAPPELWVINNSQYADAIDFVKKEISRMHQPKTPWQCPECHEYLEGQFDICWKCGSARSN